MICCHNLQFPLAIPQKRKDSWKTHMHFAMVPLRHLVNQYRSYWSGQFTNWIIDFFPTNIVISLPPYNIKMSIRSRFNNRKNNLSPHTIQVFKITVDVKISVFSFLSNFQMIYRKPGQVFRFTKKISCFIFPYRLNLVGLLVVGFTSCQITLDYFNTEIGHLVAKALDLKLPLRCHYSQVHSDSR